MKPSEEKIKKSFRFGKQVTSKHLTQNELDAINWYQERAKSIPKPLTAKGTIDCAQCGNFLQGMWMVQVHEIDTNSYFCSQSCFMNWLQKNR